MLAIRWASDCEHVPQVTFGQRDLKPATGPADMRISWEMILHATVVPISMVRADLFVANLT